MTEGGARVASLERQLERLARAKSAEARAQQLELTVLREELSQLECNARAETAAKAPSVWSMSSFGFTPT